MLNTKMFLKLAEEFASPIYRPKLNGAYQDEQKILTWLDTVNQTPFFRWFRAYYRPEIHGAEKIPDDGALLVSNHSTPYLADVGCVYIAMYDKRRRVVYGLGFDILKDGDVIKTIGGTYGTRETGIQLLRDGKIAMACPEGAVGACRPFYDKNRILEVVGFKKKNLGYLKIAHEADRPIVPVATVGGGDTVITLADVKRPVTGLMALIDSVIPYSRTHIGNKLLGLANGVPIIPLIITPPLPSKVTAYVSDPIDVRKELGPSPSQEDYWALNVHVMKTLQALIDKEIGLKK